MFSNRHPFSDTNPDFGRLQKQLNQLLRADDRLENEAPFPPVNMWQVDNLLTVQTELPGFELADLDISIDGENRLILKGTRKRNEDIKGTWHRRERAMGEIRRAIELPIQVDQSNVEAILKNGVLNITLPRKENVKPKKIEIKTK